MVLLVVAGMGLGVPFAFAQAAVSAAGPAFEVATVRPAGHADGRRWFGMRLVPSGRLTVSAMSMKDQVWAAYVGFGKAQVSGGPKWVETDQFDVEAKVDDAYMAGWDKMSDAQRMDVVRPMLRRLLADRFQLKLHTEMRDTPVYALVQAKGGARMKEVPAPESLEGEGDDVEKTMRQMAAHPGKPLPGGMMCTGSGGTGNAVPMSYALGQIGESSGADRMVLDETGLKGHYDFSYTISRDKDALSPMQQIEDQLGLRFEPRKVPITTYVIDSAEKPSEN